MSLVLIFMLSFTFTLYLAPKAIEEKHWLAELLNIRTFTEVSAACSYATCTLCVADSSCRWCDAGLCLTISNCDAYCIDMYGGTQCLVGGCPATTTTTTVPADSTSPTYSLNSTNSTNAGTAVSHNLNWTDNSGLSKYIFSFANCTGTLTNDSTVYSFSGNPAWSNITKRINITLGCTIRWRFFANDTSNNWNASLTYNYTTTDNILPTYSSNQTNSTTANTAINHTLSWADNIGLSGYIFSTNNSGQWKNASFVSFSGTTSTSWNVTIANSTLNTIVSWRFFANDTSNNWNASLTYNYTTADATSPQYSLNSTNSTLAGTAVSHNLNWTDNSGLSKYIFSFDNCTGALANDSTVYSFSGNPAWSNVTKRINTTEGCTIRWRFFCQRYFQQLECIVNLQLYNSRYNVATIFLELDELNFCRDCCLAQLKLDG